MRQKHWAILTSSEKDRLYARHATLWEKGIQTTNYESTIVVMGSDHNGVATKALLKKHLKAEGIHCVDLGPFADTPSVDYVDPAGRHLNGFGRVSCREALSFSTITDTRPLQALRCASTRLSKNCEKN